MAPHANVDLINVSSTEVNLHDICADFDKLGLAKQAEKCTKAHIFTHACTNGTSHACIRCLIDAHRPQISSLRSSLGDTSVDDLWLLRFVLSFPDSDDANQAAAKALQWRKENVELLNRVRNGIAPPCNDIISQNFASAFHGFTKDSSPINVTRLGFMTPKNISSCVPENELHNWFMYQKEYCFMLCDEATRRTGYLVKSVNFIDFSGAKLLSGRDKLCEKVLSETSKLGESIYPQLVHQSVLFNIPTGFGWAVSVLKKLLPKKMADKIVVCAVPTYYGGEEVAKCPVVKQLVGLETLPSFLGGRCKCASGCVPHTPA